MQLFGPEEREQLNAMIFEVEKMVFDTEMVPREIQDENSEETRIIWIERVKGEMSLYDIEMALESNMDYFAYFEKENGLIVTKFDIERKLDNIRKWLYEAVREKSQGRRFMRFRA
jgi:hypothetical protein